INEAIKKYTPPERIKKPSYSLVANWVKDSWDAIDFNMIKRSFKCCGISNDINGLEDDLIFDLSKLENVNNRNRGVEEENKNNITQSKNADFWRFWRFLKIFVRFVAIFCPIIWRVLPKN